MTAWGDSPTGLCGIGGNLGGQPLTPSTSPRDPSTWHQCAAPPLTEQIHTLDYGQGAQALELNAWDADGQTITYRRTVYFDNQPPTVSLSGPADAPSTAGTQYVTATAGAGPSGVAAIDCSIDGAPDHAYAGPAAKIPVSGVGQHQVRCVAQNQALDANGVRASSAPATFAMKIGVPTVTAVGFFKVVDAARCHRVAEWVGGRTRWVVVVRHGNHVAVRRRTRTRMITVTRCHMRTARRRVTIWVTRRRHGQTIRVRRHKTVRIVLAPRLTARNSRRVRHGHATTVDGWLGTNTGIALAGSGVDVLAAPDDGQGRYQTIAHVTTGANGVWSARIPAGPSRLITAAYAGGPSTEGSFAAPVHLRVPAKAELHTVTPSRVAWGGTVKLVGDLAGGYLPAGGALVRLRIGLGSVFTTFGVHEHVGGTGRFTTTYTFGAGYARIHRRYWFQIATLPMGDYPWMPSDSRKVFVSVGGHPQPARRRHR